ncbi:MAG: ROK family protein, partial [Nanoarchaeota archaeon]|nr:ROK family protein [Nanoarchaeota archaeon]
FERNGMIVDSLNNDMTGVHLTKVLKKRFPGSKIFVENDANCAVLAELKYGAGKGKNNFVMITLGSGIGGGAILNGRLYRGRGGAMEVGSMRINGEKYIWETLASGNGSVFLAHQKGLKGITSLELEKRADAGNKMAKKIYEDVGNYLGIGLSNLAYIFDPELIVVGGGFSRVKHIYPSMKKKFAELYKLPDKPKIVKASFGDDAGLIGAGFLAKM